jgi:hypothetical protein
VPARVRDCLHRAQCRTRHWARHDTIPDWFCAKCDGMHHEFMWWWGWGGLFRDVSVHAQAGTWKDLALPVPACGISLFTNAGRALLEAAQVERSSVFATVASAFRKQGTATSCGICCAVIALNAIKFVRAPSGGVALLSTGTSPRKHSRRAATAGLEVGGGMMVESEVRGRCSQLVPRADPDVLERHGLTLRQVAALCKALSAGAGEVSTYTCDHGHTICHLRHACRTRLASSAGASLSVIIANMYMGDVAKGGLGSVFPGMCWRLSSFSLRVSKPEPQHPLRNTCLSL